MFLCLIEKTRLETIFLTSSLIFIISTPNGIRTRAAALKGQYPWPLDDGGGFGEVTLLYTSVVYSHAVKDLDCPHQVYLVSIPDSRSPYYPLTDRQPHHYFHSGACQW